MTMQKGDYLRIASALRRTLDRYITDKDPEFQDFTSEILTDAALNLGQAFLAVNERFRIREFLINSLGEQDGVAAYEQHEKEAGRTKN